MSAHLLAVFDLDTAKPPPGLEYPEVHSPSPPHQLFEEEFLKLREERCSRALKAHYQQFKETTRQLKLLGKGNGYTFEACHFVAYAMKDKVHVLFAGQVGEWPGLRDAAQMAHDEVSRGDDASSEKDDGQWLLELYLSFQHASVADLQDAVLDCLSQIRGQFAFLVYDESAQRVLAARDAEGAQPLYWGVTKDGQLVFGSCSVDLEECYPSATPFPAGTLFASHGHPVAVSPGARGWVIEGQQWPGALVSFVKDNRSRWKHVKAVPRVTSKGTLCGAVYRVASEADLSSSSAAEPAVEELDRWGTWPFDDMKGPARLVF